MAKVDRIVVIVYALAMTVLLVLGSCSIDLPVFIMGAALAFLSSIAIIRQSERFEE